MEGNGLRQAIHITLRGKYNITYSGTLILHGNLTSGLGLDDRKDANFNQTKEEDDYDATGASYFVVAVILVYGMSIVALIATHINRRHVKMAEDKQIDKYLQDFQIIKEVHARDNYKNLKKSVMHKINWDRKKGTHRTLQKSILPLLAIGMQVGSSPNSMETIHQQEVFNKAKRKIYPASPKRHSDPDISDIAKLLIEVPDTRPLRVRRHSCMDQPYVHIDHGQNPSLDFLTIPDTHNFSGGGGGSHSSLALTVPGTTSYGYTGAGGVGGGSHDPASVRRLRFSSSNISGLSQLDRSLNSIAEREEEEDRDITPPQPRPHSLASTSGSGSLPTPQTSLELPAITMTPASLTKATKLRRIGVTLSQPSDDFPDDAHCLPSIPTITHEEEEISIVVDEHSYTLQDSENAAYTHSANAHNDSFMSDDTAAHASPATSLYTSYPVSIMVEEDEDDEFIDDQCSELDRIDTPESIRRPLSRRGSSIGGMGSSRDEEEDFRLTPQTILASIKFTGGTLTPNSSPRRSRSSSITSLMSRRGSKDRRKSAASIMSQSSGDGVIEVTEENPLQITCL